MIEQFFIVIYPVPSQLSDSYVMVAQLCEVVELGSLHNSVDHHITLVSKPTAKAFVELFNGKVRAECIDQNCFMTLDDARSRCEA